MRSRIPLLIVSIVAVILVAPSAARAGCGIGTPFPLCDDTCPVGLVCADVGGSCGCVVPTDACQNPANPNGPPVCYGSCPAAKPICATFAGGCSCIPTLSEWGTIAMSVVMMGGVLWLRRARFASGA